MRNVFAVFIAIVIGSAMNMSLIIIGSALIPAPEGVNPQDVDSIAANIDLFRPRHFLFPFLAHALGALAGCMTVYFIARTRKQVLVWAIGVFFLLGGIYASTIIPAPTWYIIVDLVGAYLPMAALAIFIMNKLGVAESQATATDSEPVSTGEHT